MRPPERRDQNSCIADQLLISIGLTGIGHLLSRLDGEQALRLLPAHPELSKGERSHDASPSRTTQPRTGPPPPFSVCSPRSSNVTPADVRASERPVSETRTSPGAERPL